MKFNFYELIVEQDILDYTYLYINELKQTNLILQSYNNPWLQLDLVFWINNNMEIREHMPQFCKF